MGFLRRAVINHFLALRGDKSLFCPSRASMSSRAESRGGTFPGRHKAAPYRRTHLAQSLQVGYRSRTYHSRSGGACLRRSSHPERSRRVALFRGDTRPPPTEEPTWRKASRWGTEVEPISRAAAGLVSADQVILSAAEGWHFSGATQGRPLQKDPPGAKPLGGVPKYTYPSRGGGACLRRPSHPERSRRVALFRGDTRPPPTEGPTWRKAFRWGTEDGGSANPAILSHCNMASSVAYFAPANSALV